MPTSASSLVDAGAVRVQELVPAHATPADWAAVHQYRRRRHAESGAEEPFTPDEDFERQALGRHPFLTRRVFGVSAGGTIAGTFAAAWARPDSAEHEGRKHLIHVTGYVLRDWRGRGLARRWLPPLLEVVQESGATTVTFAADDEDGHRWLGRLGAELKSRSRESRLDLADVDWPLVEGWIGEARRRSPETRLEVYERRMPEALWEEMSLVYTEIANDQPFDTADVGEFRVTVESLRQWYARQASSGQDVHTFLTREPDGAVSSYTSLRCTPARPELIVQVGTGTVARHRGRGLAKWVKAESLQYVRRACPGAKWMVTTNGHSNAAIVKINAALGFTLARHLGTYQMSAAALRRAVTEGAEP